MTDWEVTSELAKNLLVKTFPDIFKVEDDKLLIANGIEALNIVAYGNVAIVNLKNRKIYRVGEPLMRNGTIEELSQKGWIPLTYPPIIKKLKEEELSSILEEENIPLLFTNLSLLSDEDTPQTILAAIKNKEFDSNFILLWGKYIGESFWEYFSTLALRSAGIIAGKLGTTGGDIHGYYLPEFNIPKTFKYQWSIFMLHLAPLLENSEYKTFGKKSNMVQNFSESFKKMVENFPTGIVVEAESSAYSARSHGERSGIGQALKYLIYDYRIGYIAGPGVDESCLVPKEKEKIGIISCKENGSPILLNPKVPYRGSLISEDLLKWITDCLKRIIEFSRKEV